MKAELSAFLYTTRTIRSYYTSSIICQASRLYNMPKDSTHLLTMQWTRQKKKNKNKRYGTSNITLQILGSGARGAPASLFMTTDHTNYIFNCGEGSQRLANEHHLKLAKLEHVFVTTPSWKNLGGLPGLLLTIQENGVPEITLHGTEGLSEFLSAMQKFVSLTNLQTSQLSFDQYNRVNHYSDNTMQVWHVPITKSSQEVEESVIELVDNNEYYSSVKNVNGKRVAVNEEKEKNMITVEKKLKKITDTVCFICKSHPKRGTLSLQKCIELGLSPGPEFGRLKDGEDITLPSGKVICSNDVCTPPQPGIVFLVVECPTEDHLESFVNHSAFESHQEHAEVEDDKASYVFHFTSEEILNNPRYREWMNKFPNSTQHVILNDRNSCLGSEGVHKNQYELHLLHPEIFPLLKDQPFKKEEMEKDLHICRPKTMETFSLLSSKDSKIVTEISLQPQTYIDDVFALPGFLDALAELQTNINAQTKLLASKDEYPRVVMLGTGSSTPNKVRNTSGILLRIDEKHSILLDCGESTFGQIMRLYGKSEVDEILSSIKAIYISHLHADHHIGLIGLLKERSKVTNEKVYLLAPEQIKAWLQFYHNRFEQILDLFTLISNNNLRLTHNSSMPYTEGNLYTTLNVKKITTTFVSHCLFAYGVCITLKDGKKIVYSGDTRPCTNLVELGYKCDLLIHEATMEDTLVAEAKYKKHSTTSQAIDIGRHMKANFILLTHFSQRYSKIPQIPEADNVGIAYDNMDIKLSQLPLLPLLYPSLKIMYNEYYTLMEERATKRQDKNFKENS